VSVGNGFADVFGEKLTVRLAVTHECGQSFLGVEHGVPALPHARPYVNACTFEFLHKLIAMFLCRHDQDGIANTETGRNDRAKTVDEVQILIVNMN
jgi:hypothetical protein